MKFLSVFTILCFLCVNVHAANCTAKVKETHRSPPKTKSFVGVDSEENLSDYKFSVTVDGTSTYLAIVKPSGEEVSTFVVTPPPGAPATELFIRTSEGGEIVLRCRI